MSCEELLAILFGALFVPKSILAKGARVADEAVGIDWKKVLRFAFSQDIHPIMYSNLMRVQTDFNMGIPGRFAKELRRLCYNAAARDMILYHEFGKICDALHKTGIGFMPIKGVIIAHNIYPHSYLRPFKDIDILLNASELPHIVEEAFVNLGYELHNPGFGTSAFFLKKTSAGPVQVELHGQGYAWNRLHRSHQLDYNLVWKDLWQRAQTGTIEGEKVRVMSPEDLLLITCLNRADLADLRLSDVNDVMGVLTRHATGLDWDYLEERLSTTGAAIVFHLLQSFVKTMYGLDVVPELLQASLEKDVRNRVFAHLFQRASILERAHDFHLLYLVHRAIFLDKYDIRHQFVNVGHLRNLLQTRITSAIRRE
jgi:hypothetical protein